MRFFNYSTEKSEHKIQFSIPRTLKYNQKHPFYLTGTAGAATGFARTFLIRDEPAGR